MHWRTVKGVRPILSLVASFSSPDNGWASHGCDRNPSNHVRLGPDPLRDGNTSSTILLTTSDGARTWQPAGS